jgi:NADPH2:quinone reductase
VKATSINPVDLVVRNGWFPLPIHLPHIPGSDIAGTVEKVGARVIKFKPGDRVFLTAVGIRENGGYAEYCAVPQDLCVHLPENIAYEQAAACALVFLTAWHGLLDLAKIKPGEAVLVHGGAGGVGHAGVQVAKYAGARVLTTVSTKKISSVKELNPDLIVNYESDDFVEKTFQFTDGKGADIILDTVGSEIWEKNIKALRKSGRFLGITPGRNKEVTIDLVDAVIVKNISLFFYDIFDIPREEMKQALAKIIELIQKNRFKVWIDRTLPLDHAAEGHRLLKSRQTSGKIVLIP